MPDEIFVEKIEPPDERSPQEIIADAVEALKHLDSVQQYRDNEIEEYLEQCADHPSAIAENLNFYFARNWTIFERFLSFVARNPRTATKAHVQAAVKALEFASARFQPVELGKQPSGGLCENIIENIIEIAETGFFETTGSDFVPRLTALLDKSFPYEGDSFRVNEKLLWLLYSIGNKSIIPFLRRLPISHPNWMSESEIEEKVEFFRNKEQIISARAASSDNKA